MDNANNVKADANSLSIKIGKSSRLLYAIRPIGVNRITEKAFDHFTN